MKYKHIIPQINNSLSERHPTPNIKITPQASPTWVPKLPNNPKTHKIPPAHQKDQTTPPKSHLPTQTRIQTWRRSGSVGRATYRRVSALQEKEEGDEKKKQVQQQATILTFSTDFYYACSHCRVFRSGKSCLRAS